MSGSNPRSLSCGASQSWSLVSTKRRLDVAAFENAIVAGYELELVFVDDGSTDGTGRILEALRRRRPASVRIVAHRRNRGKAEAVRLGMLDALQRAPDAAGFWDADLATPLSELGEFVAVLERDSAVDLVFGSRVKLMGRTIERRLWRHYLGRVFATAASITLELPVYDTQCGAKLFRVSPTIARVFDAPFLARWVFDVEILARFMAEHPGTRGDAERAIYELPLRQWFDIGGTKLTSSDFAIAALDLARIRVRYPRRLV